MALAMLVAFLLRYAQLGGLFIQIKYMKIRKLFAPIRDALLLSILNKWELVIRGKNA